VQQKYCWCQIIDHMYRNHERETCRMKVCVLSSYRTIIGCDNKVNCVYDSVFLKVSAPPPLPCHPHAQSLRVLKSSLASRYQKFERWTVEDENICITRKGISIEIIQIPAFLSLLCRWIYIYIYEKTHFLIKLIKILEYTRPEYIK